MLHHICCYSFLILFFGCTVNAFVNYEVQIDCESGKQNFTDNKFPVRDAGFGTNYEITLRSTNRVKMDTAKFLEQNYNDTLVVRKWMRTAEQTWFNRTVLYEDNYKQPDPHHLQHNRSCKAVNGSADPELNALGLSAELLKILGIDGSSFSQLLTQLANQPNYNGTKYNIRPVMGIEAVGWLGCVRNVTGSGRNLQLNIRFAADHTPEKPYNPYWNNPLVYSTDLIFYESNGTTATILDSSTFDIVTLDRVHLADREFAATSPPGTYCEGMEPLALPLQFPMQFLAHISVTRENKEENTFDTSNNIYFYDLVNHIVAYNRQLFYSNSNDLAIEESAHKEDLIYIHDFVYGYQYAINSNGTCHSIAAIDPNSPDVVILHNGTEPHSLYMLYPEETLIYHGRRQLMAANSFYYSGKVKSESAAPLAVYTTRRPATAESHTDTDEQQLVVDVLFSLNSKGQPAQFHSIVLYNGSDSTRLESKQFAAIQPHQWTWPTLERLVRPCIKLMDEADLANDDLLASMVDTMDTQATGTGNAVVNGSDFYVQFANVTLSQLESQIGYEESLGAVAQALSTAANVSLLRLVDLRLKQFNGKQQDGNLYALFSIGLPNGGVQPAQTAYLKKELSLQQATVALNESVMAGQLQIRIPLEQPKKELLMTATAFGPQSELYPGPGPRPCPPTPMPPAPSFVGYSGSSLAICTVFAFIFGAGLVIGSYVFYQKRQHIRGIAYQVFE